jgi:hypothetical protein
MNFDYSISSGSDFISGSDELFEKKNFKSSFYGGFHSLERSILTGSYTVLLSSNSQTLVEEAPQIQNVNGKDIFSIESGDFYTTINTNNSNNIYINEINQSKNDIIIYDQKDFGSGYIYLQEFSGTGTWESNTIPNLISGINEDQPSDIDDLFENWFVFMNGQKVTGKAFAYKKPYKEYQIHGSSADVYGSSFIKDQINLYVNGMEQQKEILLQLYTGVSMIKTGEDNVARDLYGTYNNVIF